MPIRACPADGVLLYRKYGIFKVVRLRSQEFCCESCGESVGKGRVAGVGRGGKTDLKNGVKFCV